MTRAADALAARGLVAGCYDAARDADDVFALYQDADDQPLFSQLVPITSRAEFDDWLDDMLRNSYHDAWVVRAAETGEFAGFAFSYDYHPFDLHCKLCLCMAPAWRGTGAAAAVGLMALDELFCRYPLRKVYALVYDYNAQSLRSNLQAGFEEEGVLREYRYLGGRFYDCHVLACTRSRYEALLASLGA